MSRDIVQRHPECAVCGREGPICRDCKRCGDSQCNAGCISCIRITGSKWKLLLPRRIPQEDRLVPLATRKPDMAQVWAAYEAEARTNRIREYGYDPLEGHPE